MIGQAPLRKALFFFVERDFPANSGKDHYFFNSLGSYVTDDII